MSDAITAAFRLLFEYAGNCLKIPPSQLHLEHLDAPLIVNFLGHLETTRGNGAASRNIRLAAIKSFMRYMEYRVPSALEEIQRILAIPSKKTETRLVRHLTAPEMQSILDAPDPTVRDGIRDRAMLHLCCAGGLRVSELIGLRLADLTLQPQASVLVHGKGRKERCLPLWKETASALRAWLAVRGEVLVPELFLNARNTESSSPERFPVTKDQFIDVDTVLALYLSLPHSPPRSTSHDLRLAHDLYRQMIPLEVVEAAFLLASARRLFRDPSLPPLAPIRSLHYFLPVIEEVSASQLSRDYLLYLRHKLDSYAATVYCSS